LSRLVRSWLRVLGLLGQTTHEDRLDIDREIERRTGVDWDTAILERLISEEEFRAIVEAVLRRKKRKKEVEAIII